MSSQAHVDHFLKRAPNKKSEFQKFERKKFFCRKVLKQHEKQKPSKPNLKKSVQHLRPPIMISLNQLFRTFLIGLLTLGLLLEPLERSERLLVSKPEGDSNDDETIFYSSEDGIINGCHLQLQLRSLRTQKELYEQG